MRDIAVTILTGFLGSGKTTLLNRLLAHPDMEGTAVIINEFGEIGIDDVLIQRASVDAVLLKSGCVCCTIKDDLTSTLQDLVFQVMRGDLPAFRRVIIETTGLADPGPIVQILMHDDMLTAYYRLAGIVTTVDAVNGTRTLDRHGEAVHQAAVADRLLLTKSDIADEGVVKALEARLRDLNPSAKAFTVVAGEIEPSLVVNAGLFDPQTKTADVQSWLNTESFSARDAHAHHDHAHEAAPDHGVQSFAIIREESLAWEVFTQWLHALMAARGPDLLRVKGIINIAEDTDAPWVVHGVQDVFHPPVKLERWPTPDRRTRVVFVTRHLEKIAIEDALRAAERQHTP